MKQTISGVAALLIGVAILLTGQGLQGVLLPVRASLEQFSSLEVGLVGAFYFLGFTLGCWKGGELIRRTTHARVFGAMTAIASAVPLLQGLWVNLWTWGLMRFATGFCFAVLYVVIESWLNESASDENRGTIFSIYIVINMTVIAVGQQMLLLADPSGLELFAAASVLVSLAAVPVLMSRSAQPAPIESSQFAIRPLYKNSPTGMLGSFTSGLANGSFWSLGPVFALSVSGEVGMAAWFMTSVVIGGAVGQWPLGWWSDRVDRRIVLIWTCLLCTLAGLALWGWSGYGRAVVIALAFVWGMGAFPVYSVSVAQANDRADPGTFVMISSGLLLMYGAGAIIGPFLSSGLMMVLGNEALFLFAAATHILLAVFVTSRFRRDKQVRAAAHGEFSDALTSALTASQVYEEELKGEAKT